MELRRRRSADGCDGIIKQASVLDKGYLRSLRYVYVVYSWAVLHHTGEMWRAIENSSRAMPPRRKLCLGMYNNDGAASCRWVRLIALYNRVSALRPLLTLFGLFWLGSGLHVRGLLSAQAIRVWRSFGRQLRGMSARHDLIDWLGGYPYEHASRIDVERFLWELGFRLDGLTSVGVGPECTDFLFARVRSCGL